nr:uncharacterized protein LOC111995759 [Quercus suber]
MRSVFMGKNVAQWLIANIEHIVVGANSKQFFTFRDSDIAFTLYRSTNFSGQFLLLTELKVGGSRRSIIISEGKEKCGWRAFGLELRKLLYPSQYAVGGTGHHKFIPQVHRHYSEVQNYKTFAEAVQGYQGKIVDRKHLKQLGTTDKGKMTQSGMNQRCSGAKMGDFPVGKSDMMVVGGGVRREQGINGETEVGEQNPVGQVKRSPLKFRSNGSIHGFGKNSPDLAAIGLTIEVNREGKRKVVWRSYKGDLRNSIWVKRDQREQVVSTPRGSRVRTNPELFKGGLRHSKGVSMKDHVVGPSKSP